jgi:hypothetical protein
MFAEIKREIASARFVAIFLDGTTDTASKSQLSTMVRYVTNNGRVQERFLGFNAVREDRSSKALAEHDFIDEYGIGENKLVSKTYDGAAVIAGEMNGLQSV